MEEYGIKLKELDSGNIIDAVVKENGDRDDILLAVTLGDKQFSAVNEDYFTAFQQLRDRLLDEGYGMCCAGAKENALQSGMMAGSDRVYLVTLGSRAVMKSISGIFDYADMDKFPDSGAQQRFTQSWYESIS